MAVHPRSIAQAPVAPRSRTDLKEATHIVKDAEMHAWLRKRQRNSQLTSNPVRRFVSRVRRAELTACFEALDTDKSGSIEREEVTFALRQLGLSATHTDYILNEGDTDGNGSVDCLRLAHQEHTARPFAPTDRRPRECTA